MAIRSKATPFDCGSQREFAVDRKVWPTCGERFRRDERRPSGQLKSNRPVQPITRQQNCSSEGNNTLISPHSVASSDGNDDKRCIPDDSPPEPSGSAQRALRALDHARPVGAGDLGDCRIGRDNGLGREPRSDGAIERGADRASANFVAGQLHLSWPPLASLRARTRSWNRPFDESSPLPGGIFNVRNAGSAGRACSHAMDPARDGMAI